MTDEEPRAVVARIVPLRDTDQPGIYAITCPRCQAKAMARRQEGYTSLECPVCHLTMYWEAHCLLVRTPDDSARKIPDSS